MRYLPRSDRSRRHPITGGVNQHTIQIHSVVNKVSRDSRFPKPNAVHSNIHYPGSVEKEGICGGRQNPRWIPLHDYTPYFIPNAIFPTGGAEYSESAMDPTNRYPCANHMYTHHILALITLYFPPGYECSFSHATYVGLYRSSRSSRH